MKISQKWLASASIKLQELAKSKFYHGRRQPSLSQRYYAMVDDLSAGHHAADGAPQDLGRRSKVEGSLTRIGVPQADMENSSGSLLPPDV